ncbi:MAG: RNA polymerase sigma factor [Bacteroidia bacterium]
MTEDREDMLINGCIKGDRLAQNMLYEQYCAKMFALCFRYSKNREEAEDTFHEGFMKVYEHIKSFRKSGSLEGWIRKIMINTAIEKYRKNPRLFIVQSINGNDAELNQYSTDDILSNIEAGELMKLIHKLPPVCKLVFNLYEFEGLKHKEIAEKLGISEGTSRSNLHDARRILQRAVYNNNNIPEQIISVNGRG